MSRKLTTRPPEHPHNQLCAFKQHVKEHYRTYSSEKLFQLKTGGPECTRKQMLTALIQKWEVIWKEQFQTKNGFPFDDIYDQAKFAEHLKKLKDVVPQTPEQSIAMLKDALAPTS